jgi:hypothetical protein
LQKWQEKKNDKKSNNEKKSKNDISNVKFVNMTNIKSLKYASLFINKTFNNFLWRSVIYDFDCNDSFIYDLNQFVNEWRLRIKWSIHQTILCWSKNMKSCSTLITSTKKIEECSSTTSFMCHLLTLFWCS